MSEYDELLSFLTSSRVDLQEETLKVILHLLQSSPEGSVQYFKEDSRMDIFINLLKVPALASYTINILNLLITFLPTVTESSLIPATTSLDTLQTSSSTSISTNHQLFPSQQYSDQIMTILLTYLFTSTNSSLLNISLALLNNLTIPMENAELFISKVLNNPNIFQKLLNKFLEYNPQLEEDHEPASFHELDPWQYFSSVLCNLCRDERIQLFLLNKSTNNMVLLSKQVVDCFFFL